MQLILIVVFFLVVVVRLFIGMDIFFAKAIFFIDFVIFLACAFFIRFMEYGAVIPEEKVLLTERIDFKIDPRQKSGPVLQWPASITMPSVA